MPRTVAEMRAHLLERGKLFEQTIPSIAELHENVKIADYGESSLTADILQPGTNGPWPVLLYMHGGGWVSGNVRTHRKIAALFAAAGFLVVNLDYRLAPEHRYPAQLDDALAAIQWIRENADHYGGDPKRLAVGGDSAGAQMAASAAVALGKKGMGDVIKALLLIYGIYDFGAYAALGFEAQGPNASNPELTATRKIVDVQVHSLLGGSPNVEQRADTTLNPIHAVKHLPPSFVVAGMLDGVMPLSKDLVDEMKKRDLTYECLWVEGAAHGFIQSQTIEAKQTVTRMCEFLKHWLGS